MGRAVGGRAAARLLAGRMVSRFGSSGYLVALPLYVLERTCWPFPSWGRLWSAPTGKDC